MHTQALRAALLAVAVSGGLMTVGVPPPMSRVTSVTAAPHVELSPHSGPPNGPTVMRSIRR
jgi:hypothetical protein